MKPIAPVPRVMMAKKPPHGAPCTRCGVCCYVVQCELSLHLFGPRPGPCPALVIPEDGRAVCGLVEGFRKDGATQLATAAALLIGAGDGCDARFNGEPTDHRFHAKQARFDELRAVDIKAARQMFGMPLR